MIASFPFPLTETSLMSDNFRDELDQETGEYPESWKPEPGDMVIGEVLRYDTGYAEWQGNRRQHPILVIRVEDIQGGADVAPGENLGIWMMHKVLREEVLKTWRPEEGETVGIKMLEPKRDKRGHELYHRYAVRVKGRGPSGEGIPDPDAFDPASDEGADLYVQREDAPLHVGPTRDEPPPHDDADLPF